MVMLIFGSSLILSKDLENFCTNLEGHALSLNAVNYNRNTTLYNIKTDGRVLEEDAFRPLNASSS